LDALNGFGRLMATLQVIALTCFIVLATDIAFAQWSAPESISNGVQPANAVARLTDSNGNEHVIFWEVPGVGTIQLFHTWSPAGGGAWSAPVMVSHTGQGATLPPAPFAHALDTFLTPGSTAPRRDYEYAGYTFFTEGPDGLELFFESVPGVGVAQVFHTIWDGIAWSAPVDVSQATQPAAAVAFQHDSLGTGHLIWWAIPGVGTLQLHYANRPAGGTWSAPVQVSNTGQFAKFPPSTVQDRCVNTLAGAPLWDYPVPEYDTDYSSYQFLLEDDVGNLHFFFESIPGIGVAQVWHMSLDVSNLAGGWSTPVNISQASQPADAIAIVKDSDGALHVVFSAIPGLGTPQLHHTSLASGGATWSTPVNVSQSTQLSVLPPILYADGIGGWDCNQVIWWAPVNPELDYQYSAQRFFRQVGRELHVFFESIPGVGVAQLWNSVLDLDNPGAGWSAPVDISQNGQPVNGVGIEEDSTGTLHVIFRGIPGVGTLQLHHTYRAPGGAWSAPVQVSHTAQPATFAGGVFADPYVTMNANGFVPDIWDYEYAFYDFLWEDATGHLNLIFDSIPGVGVQQVWHSRLPVATPAAGWSAPTNVSNAVQPATTLALDHDLSGQTHVLFVAIPGTGTPQLHHSIYDPTSDVWTAPEMVSHTAQGARLSPAILADPIDMLEFDYEYSAYRFFHVDDFGDLHLFFESVPGVGVQEVWHTVYAPEPGAVAGLACGLLALVGLRRRRPDGRDRQSMRN